MRRYEHAPAQVVHRPPCGRVRVSAQVAIQDIAAVTFKPSPPDEADQATVRGAVVELQPTWDALRRSIAEAWEQITGDVRTVFQLLTSAGLDVSEGES